MLVSPPRTFAPESNQILAISSLRHCPRLAGSSKSMLGNDVHLNARFHCPGTGYRLEDIIGLRFKRRIPGENRPGSYAHIFDILFGIWNNIRR
ncbi:hypothetical protein V1477_012569 [Vespula maculifrons]|uniref:Uncharacterized protein n=2 Tax=Vespula TaxID=7451 RepID=A0A834N2N3_VESVU|nr:hypothetical protein HZH66_008612 [Vespula vulgaris]